MKIDFRGTNGRSTATFKLHLSSDLANGRKIQGLPYGTDYAVTEQTSNADLPTAPANSSWVNLTSPTPIGTIGTGTPTADITNGLVGSLTITKSVSGNAPTTAQTYPFVVELSRDDELDLNDYSVTGGTTNWYHTTTKKGTINVSVSTTTANASTIINNIPYGTKYKVYENTAGLPSFMTSSSDNTTDHPAITNTTGVTGAHTATITNTYNTGSLKITKALAGTNLPNGATEYTFTDTFTRSDNVALGDYSFTTEATGTNLPNGSSVSVEFSRGTYSNGSGTFTAKITIPAGATTSTTGSITISGIPTGTNFTVQESSRRDGSTVSPASGNGSISTAGATVEKTFTNTYHDTTSLTLQKSVTTTGTIPTTVYNQDNAEYTLLVTLQEPSGIPFSAFDITSSQTLYTVEAGAATSTELNPHNIESGRQFAVKLGYNGTVTFGNLPDGTKYKVEETSDSKANTTGYDGDVTDNYADIPSGNTHTVNNKYEVGSLKVRKTTTGDLPNNAPSDGNYSVTVTLNAPANVSDFAAYSLTPPAGATLESGSTATHKVYTVTVHANNNTAEWVTFTNVPYNTTYKVEEADQTTLGNPTVTYTESDTGSISGTNEVVINNSYLNTHKLTLSKSFDNGTTNTTDYAAKYGVDNTTRFKYHVTLSGLGTYSVNAQSVDNDSNHVSTTSYTPTSGSAEFEVYVTSGKSVEITGLPDNATYSVYEDRSYGADTYLPANVDISADGNGTGGGTSTSPRTESNITGDKAVTIINTYTDTGSLTLKKSVVNRTAVEVPSAVFNVTLLIRNTVDAADYNIVIDGDNSASLGTPDTTSVTGYKKYTFAVTVPNNSTGVVVKHLPYGTQYYVLEDSTSYPDGVHDWVTGEVAEADKVTLDTSHLTGSVTITNTYPQKGTLQFRKNALAGTAATAPGNTFTFEVTLTPPSAMDGEVFIENYIGTSEVATPAEVAANNGIEYSKFVRTNDGKLMRRYNMTAGATWTSIENLPFNTTYTVDTEINFL